MTSSRNRPAVLGTLGGAGLGVPPDASQPRTSRPGAPSAPPLTPAELRLLPYLQTHLTIREIAERLFVSRNTVNTELGSIYRKLGVTTRNGAVERSTSMGLLGG